MTRDEFTAALEAGPYAWPGGYPLYFVMIDGAALSFEAAKAERCRILDAIEDGAERDWIPAACDVNWEDPDLYCDHTGTRIESAYAEPETFEPEA